MRAVGMLLVGLGVVGVGCETPEHCWSQHVVDNTVGPVPPQVAVETDGGELDCSKADKISLPHSECVKLCHSAKCTREVDDCEVSLVCSVPDSRTAQQYLDCYWDWSH